LLGGLLLPFLEALDEGVALRLPVELAEPHQRLGHFARRGRLFLDEGLEQNDRLGTQRFLRDDVAIDTR
jgi:hypothetical protein